MASKFGLSKRTGVGLYQRPSDRVGDNSKKIYMFKSLKGLGKKEKLYALGYNLTSASAVIPGFDVGMIGAAPYLIGQATNTLNAITKGFRGDMGAVLGRSRFLGGVNILNKGLGQAFNKISSPTGLPPIDRYANIYIGQQKAKYLHYARKVGTKDKLKVLVETFDNVFDKQLQAQAASGYKGNVFNKWQRLTYYNAVKDAPDPWKDNPYVQARKASRSKEVRQFRNQTKTDMGSTTMQKEHLATLMNESDFLIEEAVSSTTKALAIEAVLENDHDFLVNKKMNGIQLAKKLKTLEKKGNRARLGGMKDNVLYKFIERQEDVFFPSIMGFRGTEPNTLIRRHGIIRDKAQGTFTTEKSRTAQDTSYKKFVSQAAMDNGHKTRGKDKADIFKVALDTPVNNTTITAFNEFAADLGMPSFMKKGENMNDFTSKVAQVLFQADAGRGGQDIAQAQIKQGQALNATNRLASKLHEGGYPKLADAIVRTIDPDRKVTKRRGHTFSRKDAALEGLPQGSHYMEIQKEFNNIMMETRQFYDTNKNFKILENMNKRKYGGQLRIMELNDIHIDPSNYVAEMEAHTIAKNNARKTPIPGKQEYIGKHIHTKRERKKIAKQYLISSGMFKDEFSAGTSAADKLARNTKIERYVDKILRDPNMTVKRNQYKMPKPLPKPGPNASNKKHNQYENYMKERKLVMKRNRNKNKLIRDIQTFIDKGTPPDQILKYIEKQYDGAFGKELAKLKKPNKFHGRTSSDLQEIYGDRGFDKNMQLKGETGDGERLGASTFKHGSHNYVPSKTHIIDAIHMTDIEMNGQNEDDGVGYLFRYGVEFGGHNKNSENATRIRDAVAIEFGGPATDLRGGLSRRTDRMFYPPSFFIGIAASKSAAYLGIFDKGAAFKASANAAGIDKGSFKIEKEGVGVLNATRKNFNEEKREFFEGHRRVKQMFKDADKAIKDHTRANFNRDAVGGEAMRLANQRAMKLFNQGGGFGQINISDVGRVAKGKELGMFGITETGLGRDILFDENSLGAIRRTGTSMNLLKQGEKRSMIYNDGASNHYLKSKTFKAPIVKNYLKGADAMDMGYSPMVPILSDLEGKLLQRGRISPMKRKGPTEMETDLYGAISKGQSGFSGINSSANVASQTAAALSRGVSNTKFIEDILTDPYEGFLKYFELGRKKSGSNNWWHAEDGTSLDISNPMHPVQKFYELFGGTQTFKNDLINDFFYKGAAQARPVMNYLQQKGDTIAVNALHTKIRMEAGRAVNSYMRAVGQQMNAIGSSFMMSHQQFKDVTMNAAVMMYANRENFNYKIDRAMGKYLSGAKMSAAAQRRVNREIAMENAGLVMTPSAALQDMEKIVSQGLAISYDGVDGNPQVMDLLTGNPKGTLADFLSESSSVDVAKFYPLFNEKGRTPNKMYKTDQAQQIMVMNFQGVNDFQEIQWNRSGRFGQNDASEDFSRLLKGDRWAVSRALAEETGSTYTAEEIMGNNSLLVSLLTQNPHLKDYLHTAEKGWVNAGFSNVEIEYNLINEGVRLFIKENGLGAVDKLNTRVRNFGYIVAETKQNKAGYNDFTPLRTMLNENEKFVLQGKLRFLAEEMAVGTYVLPDKLANRFVSVLYDHYHRGSLNNQEIAFVLAEGVKHYSSPEDGMVFLKTAYNAFLRVSGPRVRQGIRPGPGQGGAVDRAANDARIAGIFEELIAAGNRGIDNNLSVWGDRKWMALAQIIQASTYTTNPGKFRYLTGGMVFTDDDYMSNPKTVRKAFAKVFPKTQGDLVHGIEAFRIQKIVPRSIGGKSFLKIRYLDGPGRYKETLKNISRSEYLLYRNKIIRKRRGK